MRPDFIFRSGKYQGKTYSYVRKVDPRWLSWVEANRPEMLKEHKTPGFGHTGQGKTSSLDRGGKENPEGKPRYVEPPEESDEVGDSWTNPHRIFEIAERLRREGKI